MKEFFRAIQIRWSDLDPNYHLRHSVYYDWGAFCRVEFFNEHGLTGEVMMQAGIGPILFREECVFRREIKSGDSVQINLQVTRARKDYSRWSIRHQIIKNENILCAELNVDGAWMSMVHRRLMSPPEKMHEVFQKMPVAEGFVWQ